MKILWQDHPVARATGHWLMVITLSALAILALVSCGGGSGSGANSGAPSSGTQSSSSAANRIEVTGTLGTPLISGAFVRLDDAQGKALAAVQQTAHDGRFSFTDIAPERLAGAIISAKGGVDLATGMDYTGFELRALYQGQALQVTPISTLVTHAVINNGETLNQATTRVASVLGVDFTNLAASTTTLGLIRQVQLARLASGLRTQGGFSKVATLIHTHGVDWAAMERALAQENPLTGELLALSFSHIRALEELDLNLAPQASLAQINQRAAVIGVTHFMANALNYRAQHPQYFNQHLEQLAQALVAANQQRGLALSPSTFTNLLRYSFATYAITPAALDSADFLLNPLLHQDPKIAAIASLTAMDYTLALPHSEYLSDMAAKRAYYYSSTLAPAYRAAQLFKSVVDDNYTDEIHGYIAAAYAANGMTREAEVILQSQIFSPYWLAYAYLRTGNSTAKNGDIASAKVLWDTAAGLLQSYLSDKGLNTLNADDASIMQQLANAYLQHGFSDAAAAAIAPANAFLLDQARAYTTAYGRLLVAIGAQAGAAVDAAEAADLSANAVNDAQSLVDFYAQVVANTGLQSATTSCGDHYMLKASGYTALADLYARLGNPSAARAQIANFNQLRSSHACTATRTHIYVKNLVDAYGALNDIDGYLTLVDSSMIGATAAQKSAAIAAANRYVALQLALAGEVPQAVQTLTGATIGATLAALTNTGVNEKPASMGLALQLAGLGHTQSAAAVLDAAWQLASSESYASEQRDSGYAFSRLGCGKLADLSARLVSPASGATRFAACRQLVDNFSGAGNALAGAEAQLYLATIALRLGDNAGAQTSAQQSLSDIATLPLAQQKILLPRLILNAVPDGLLATGIDMALLLEPMTQLESHYREQVAAATSQSQWQELLLESNQLLSSYGYLLQGLRASVVSLGSAQGQVYPQLASQIANLQARAFSLVQSSQAVASQVSNASARATFYDNLIGDRGLLPTAARAELFNHADTILTQAALSESIADINHYRVQMAKALLNFSAFGGINYARVDTDNDGLVDFFEANVSATELDHAHLGLDGDVDNDGIADAADNTPFWCDHCALP